MAPERIALTGGMNRATRGRPGYSREDVIRAAVNEFTVRGYDATSMGTVASVLGISKSALYHHISSKEEILELSVNKALRELQDVVESAEGLEGSAADKLRVAVRGSVRVLAENHDSVTLLLRLRGNSEVEVRALEKRRRVTRSMQALVVAAQEDGEIRGDIDARVASRFIFGLVNSLTDWYTLDGPMSPDDVADQLLAFIFGGIEKR